MIPRCFKNEEVLPQCTATPILMVTDSWLFSPANCMDKSKGTCKASFIENIAVERADCTLIHMTFSQSWGI